MQVRHGRTVVHVNLEPAATENVMNRVPGENFVAGVAAAAVVNGVISLGSGAVADIVDVIAVHVHKGHVHDLDASREITAHGRRHVIGYDVPVRRVDVHTLAGGDVEPGDHPI